VGSPGEPAAPPAWIWREALIRIKQAQLGMLHKLACLACLHFRPGDLGDCRAPATKEGRCAFRLRE
jgi:hypothetical protein